MEKIMKNGFFLITGTSRRIGEALAQRLLGEGHMVLGVSRNQSDDLRSSKYYHLSIDLTETSKISQIMEKVNEIAANQSFDFVCLVNNASAVEPIGPIEKCPTTDIESHVRIGLITPMLLTSMFIRRFSGEKIRKKVVFIASGAAFTALPDQSIYCSSKAGIHMFAQCVGLEQKDKEQGFEVNTIGPGMVDTSMQRVLRFKTSDEFALAGFFKQAFEAGKLQEPGMVAEKIYAILENKYEQGKYVSVDEM
jgi:benzil reductase ((S)-benzoin forming)